MSRRERKLEIAAFGGEWMKGDGKTRGRREACIAEHHRDERGLRENRKLREKTVERSKRQEERGEICVCSEEAKG